MEEQLRLKHMVNKNYNKKRHYELLKKKSMGINLQEYSSELGQYSCMLEAHLDWQGRESYLKLLENFQKGKIQDVKFCFAFEERGLLISDISDILKSNLILLSPQNLQYLMEKDKVNFYGPGLPWIIVQKLTKEIIQEAIKAYLADKPDGYWLKLYYFANDIDIAVFNQLQAEEIEENAKLNLLIGLDDLKAKIDKLDNLDKSKKSDLVTSLNKLYKNLEL